MMNFTDKPQFYPCYINFDQHKNSLAFGWKGFFVNDVEGTKSKFVEYLQSQKHLTSLFDNDKIYELATSYFLEINFIRQLFVWANWYINRVPESRPEFLYTDDEFIQMWNKKVKETYLNNKFSQSLFERTIFNQLLNDYLWNPLLDPSNPIVYEYNMQVINKPRADRIVSTSIYESTNPEDEHYISQAMISKDQKAALEISSDPLGHYDTIANNLHNYRLTNDINAMKHELSKMYLIYQLIDINYNHALYPDKHTRHDLSDLKNKIGRTLNIYLEVLAANDAAFNFKIFYETTEFVKVYRSEQNMVSHMREVMSCIGNV